MEYRVKWRGYPSSDNTWETAHDIPLYPNGKAALHSFTLSAPPPEGNAGNTSANPTPRQGPTPRQQATTPKGSDITETLTKLDGAMDSSVLRLEQAANTITQGKDTLGEVRSL